MNIPLGHRSTPNSPVLISVEEASNMSKEQAMAQIKALPRHIRQRIYNIGDEKFQKSAFSKKPQFRR